jgi:hypothetical protein
MNLSTLSRLMSFVLFVSCAGNIAHAADHADHSCQIFIVDAEKVNANGGSFVEVGIAVKKELAGTSNAVAIHYLNPSQQWDDVVAEKSTEKNDYAYYTVRFDYGKSTEMTPIQMTAFVSVGADRLFDNNRASDVILNPEDGNSFTPSRCTY